MTSLFRTLHRVVSRAFSEEELKTICFDWGIEYSNLVGEIYDKKVASFIKLLGRTNRLSAFVMWAKTERSNYDWPDTDWNSFDWSADEPEPKFIDSNIEPYKGLAYFDYTPTDIQRFFGRDALISELVQKIQSHIKDPYKANFLAIIGASGSGKSSLVRAGIVPSLMNESEFKLHILTPTGRPLETLAASLTRESESVTATSTLIDDLQREPLSLQLYVRKSLELQNQAHMKLLLVVDQFEELFTLCHNEAERTAFINNLTAAVTGKNNDSTIIIITIRADFYHRCAPYDQLRDLLDQQQKYIGNISKDGLRDAIEKPAQQAGYVFEAGLIKQILQDVGQEPGRLPLLSHALQETWRRREGLKFTLAGYLAAGGVQGAIAQTAETTYQYLTKEQQKIVQQIFLRLTQLGEGTHDTRRRVNIEELNFEANVEDVTQQLADARLVTTNDDGIDVAHEALIREWPRLRVWLDRNREVIRLHRHLSVNAITWKNESWDPSYLYRGARLEQAEGWIADQQIHLSELEMAFLQASLQARQKRQARIAEENRQKAYRAVQLQAMNETFSTVRTRVFIAFLLSTLTIIGIGLFISLNLVIGSSEERIDNLLLDSGQIAAGIMIEYEQERLEVLRTIRFTNGVPQAVRENNDEQLGTLVPQIVQNNNADMVAVINRDGRELFGAQRVPGGSEFVFTSGADYSAFEDVQLVLNDVVDEIGDKRAFLGQTPSMGSIVLITVGPVYDEDELVGAVLVGSNISELVSGLSEETVARITLYDRSGEVIATTLGVNSLTTDSYMEILQQVGVTAEDVENVISQTDDQVQRNQVEILGQPYEIMHFDWRVRNQSFGLYSVATPSTSIVSSTLFVTIFTGLAIVLIIFGFILSRSIQSILIRSAAKLDINTTSTINKE